jgi:hypothetical protein
MFYVFIIYLFLKAKCEAHWSIASKKKTFYKNLIVLIQNKIR